LPRIDFLTTVVHYPDMTRTDPQMKLRLPPQLKGAIEEAAGDEQRSLNAEIVQRLYASFDYENEKRELLAKIAHLEAQQAASDAKLHEMATVKASLEQERLASAKSGLEWEEWATKQFTDENTVYVLLDADGHPISWDEIVTHLAAISEAVGGNVERIEAGVFDAPRQPNDKRFDQWVKLREYYRKKRSITPRKSKKDKLP
jgi:hypothetical protein